MAVDSSQLTPADWDRIRAGGRPAATSDADGVVDHARHRHHGGDRAVAGADLRRRRPRGAHRRAAQRGRARRRRAGQPARRAGAWRASPDARGLGVLVSFAGTVWQPLGLHKVATADLRGFAGRRSARSPTARSPRSVEGPAVPRRAVGRRRAAGGHRRGVPGQRRRGDGRLRGGGRAGHRAGGAGFGQRRAAVIDGVRGTAATGWRSRCRPGCPAGRSAPATGPAAHLVDAGAVVVPRLRPPQARVLLMAALAAGSPVEDVVARWG